MNSKKAYVQPYSDHSIKRAVRLNSIQHPLVLYPCAAGLLGGVAVGLLGVSVPLVAIAGIGTALGLGSLATNYFLEVITSKGFIFEKYTLKSLNKGKIV